MQIKIDIYYLNNTGNALNLKYARVKIHHSIIINT